jgi:hypothetical protein
VNLLEQSGQVARRDGGEPGRLAVADGEGELPLTPAQFKSQVQPWAARGNLSFADRCHDELLGKEKA